MKNRTREMEELFSQSEYREVFGKKKFRRHKDLYQIDMEGDNGNIHGYHPQGAGGFEVR